MGVGIIMGAMGGLGDAGQAVAQQNQKLWDTQALAQQQSDLDVLKHTSAANLENKNAIGMLYQKNAAADAEREQMAARIQAGMAPALQQATIQNAQADPDYDWVPVDAKVNPDGTAAAGTPTVTPAMSDLSAADVRQYAPTSDQQTAAYLAAAKNTADLGPQGILQGAIQDAANKRMEAMQLQSQVAAAQLQQNQIAATSANQDKQMAATAANYARSGSSASPVLQKIAYMDAHPALFTKQQIADVLLEKPQPRPPLASFGSTK
jgi:hypothetical protein